MLRSLENLEFIAGDANGLEVQMRTQGEMVEMALYLETFQFEESIKNSKDMIILAHDSADGRFAQGSIVFE
jgi:hypothetical protein